MFLGHLRQLQGAFTPIFKTYYNIICYKVVNIFYVHGSVHHSTIHKQKIQQNATVYENFIIPHLYDLDMFRAPHRPSSGA
jgi:hypothetical protein